MTNHNIATIEVDHGSAFNLPLADLCLAAEQPLLAVMETSIPVMEVVMMYEKPRNVGCAWLFGKN